VTDVKNYGTLIAWVYKRSLTDIGSANIAAPSENRIHVLFSPRTAIVLATVLQIEGLAVNKEDTEVSTMPMIPAGHRCGNQFGIESTLISISPTTMKRAQPHTCGVTDRGTKQIDASNTLGNVEWKLRSSMAQAVGLGRRSQHSWIIDQVTPCLPGHQLSSRRQPPKRAQRN
jgi:hypothetical protein